ncbi:hypothetical protein [Candidatus Poriferisocius sp.]|uniref:hypothetical protein n=1 Tax=Candidatus Poriferisocius sp. TaxID=3101276 RepID=UPI003B5C5442
MRGKLIQGLGALVAIGALIAFGTAPVAAQDDFDAEAASEEVVENLIDLFTYLDVAGNPDSSAAEAEEAVSAAAALIEGGDTAEVQGQIPGIAALAHAAELTVVIDEEPTFSEDNTQANYLFSALSFGNPSQVDGANGIHVLEDGTWKLSSLIWQAFVAMGGDAQPEDMGDGGVVDGGADDTGQDEELANTGLNTGLLVVIAVAMLAAGVMLMTASRRARSTV